MVAAVHGVAKSWTWLSDFTFISHFHALEKEMATHSSVLAWRIPGTGEPGGLPSMGSHRVKHDWSDLAAAAGLCFFKRLQGRILPRFFSSFWGLLAVLGTSLPIDASLQSLPLWPSFLCVSPLSPLGSHVFTSPSLFHFLLKYSWFIMLC